MPFYCGVQKVTIPLSILCGVVFGFILMWAVFGTFIYIETWYERCAMRLNIL